MTNIKELFNITDSKLNSLIAQGLKGGGDWCDLYFENTEFFNLLLRDGAVSAGGHHIDYGCGIRVLCGEKTGYAYSESTDWNSLLSAADAASSIAQSSGKCTGYPVFSKSPIILDCGHSRYKMEKDWRDGDASGFVPFLENLEAEIRKRDERVYKVTAMLSNSVSTVLMYNSLGELTSDIRPLGSVNVTVVFKQDGKVEQKRVSHSIRSGIEMLTPNLLKELATKATKDVDLMFEAKRPKGGRMPVVMGAGASGILLHEAMGHAFEADFNRKGQSVFSDKLGKKVCMNGINIVDDGTIQRSRGAINFDDEGVPGQKTYMVNNGILTSFLHDRISAKCYGVAPTGNGRRESFRYNPIPRMRTTYMESGDGGTANDLISSVKKGIYVDQFANGEVKIGEGDFTFYVKSGFLIENGKLTMPVKDVNIIGNGPEALSDIVAVGTDMKIDEGTWTCGKGQSVSVSCGMPSVLVKKLTVGGE